ncbi:alpha/beta-hydrolase [Aspergillus affinis]|uniref:alpha/beta-hydrolase n=1 Tax=Aspergillus affinis TaxID=1070780 RepID=UPI0022FEACB7|nr:alpha/beta-hydrolase [Aspergillus affinis]KAI9037468.1 alpha/beta-hydrolase [Aspergillus affinis]
MKVLYGLLLPLLASALPAGSPVVDLGYSTYRGVRLSAGIEQYVGMRFAAPPLGELRFRAPRDPVQESSIQNAFTFGPSCLGVKQEVSAEKSEDCLYINVFAPANATNLPVWVYIEGGGYATNFDPNYNGTNVIRESGHNIIFVNFNYRVGALGFLASEEVRRDGDLNAGLLDQRKALRWVRQHIRKFGGNPDHVVIQGASAGGGSVAHHLTAYGGRDDGLFVGAVAESPFWPAQPTVAEAESQFDRFANETGCSDSPNILSCLRSLDISTLEQANVLHPLPGASDEPLPLWYWLPVVDGDIIPDSLYNLFDGDKYLKVPLLVGSNTDDGSEFAYNASTPAEVSAFINSNYPRLSPDQLKAINEAYPREEPMPQHAAYFPSASAAYGDAAFTCPATFMADAMMRSTGQVWEYLFNLHDPAMDAMGLGVRHMLETEAIFGVGYGGVHYEAYTAENAAIVPVMMDYFISFVRALDPNVFRETGTPEWKEWGQGEQLVLQHETEMGKVSRETRDRCGLWRSLGSVMEV